MKIKIGFVTNSSSTNFTITNKSNKRKTLVDFVKENPQLIEMYRDRYCYDDAEKEKFTQERLIESAKSNNIIFNPHENRFCTFGDEQGTFIGAIFDYILRAGGSSKSFIWRFESYSR